MNQIGPKFGPNLGQIGPKKPILKIETRDFGSLYVLRVFTTTSALIRLFELTPVTKWVKWTKIGTNVGQKLAKFGSK
jgi:hypothetical protein